MLYISPAKASFTLEKNQVGLDLTMTFTAEGGSGSYSWAAVKVGPGMSAEYLSQEGPIATFAISGPDVPTVAQLTIEATDEVTGETGTAVVRLDSSAQ